MKLDITEKRLAIIEQLPYPLNTMLIELAFEQLGFFASKQINNMCEAAAMSQFELGLALLPLAASFAITPVSNFQVGAVAFDSVGNAYLGANFEFSGNHIGQTIHAEQSAIAHMWQRGATDLALLVINYAPCGHCRQFINEVNVTDDFLIQLPDSEAKPLSHYLPDSFGGADLGVAEKILHNSQGQQANCLSGGLTNDCLALATHAHDHCHAPYSGNKCGIAVEYSNVETDKETDLEVITGRYGENAAYNPSLPALQVALNYRRMQGKDWDSIKRVVMVETVTSLSQKENTRSLLASINQDIPIDYIDWYEGSSHST